MAALLVLLATLFTWIALYQGILAYAVTPPTERDFATIAGIVHHVDTPVTRNRFVASTELQITVGPVRIVRVAVREATMSTDALRQLQGKPVEVRIAANRPRNRWVYEIKSEDRTLVSLATEQARDASAHASSLRWMFGSGALGLAFLAAAWRVRRRRGSPEAGFGAQKV